MIKIKKLVKRFGPFTAVNGVTFSAATGEVLGFLGPNGAGKSTTMKMAAGFLTPTSGRVSIAGFDVEDRSIEAKRALGYLPEGAPAYGDMTPRDFLRFVARMRGLDSIEARSAITAMVEQVELEAVLEQPIETLSKGFKRRVGLAAAVLHDPPVLILDEPTDGLDPNQKHEVRRFIRRMAPRKTIVISTHILEEVEAVCTRAIVIDWGQVVADGTPADLAARSPYHGALHVRLHDVVPSIKMLLAAVSGVRDVVVPEGVSDGRQFLVLPEVAGTRESVGTREAVAERLAENAIVVDSLNIVAGRLDDVFRQLTTSDAEKVRA